MIWVFIIVCLLIWLALNVLERDDDKGFYNFLILTMTAFGIIIGLLLGEEIGVRTDKPIKPSIVVECKDGKCDTTYIYRGGNE
jgi:hypothetical protein